MTSEDEFRGEAPEEVPLLSCRAYETVPLGTERVAVVVRKTTSPYVELANLTYLSSILHGSSEKAWVIYYVLGGVSCTAWSIPRGKLLHTLFNATIRNRMDQALMSLPTYHAHLLEGASVIVKHAVRSLLGTIPHRVLRPEELGPFPLARGIMQTVTEEKLSSFVPEEISGTFVHQYLRDKGIVEWLPEWP